MVVAAVGQILVGTIPLTDVTSTQATGKFFDIHVFAFFPVFFLIADGTETTSECRDEIAHKASIIQNLKIALLIVQLLATLVIKSIEFVRVTRTLKNPRPNLA